MPVIAFTTKSLDALVAKRSSERVDYFDRSHKGLCFRVGQRGASWYAFKRTDGKLDRLLLGSYPVVGLAEARRKFDEVVAAASEGQHPRAHLSRERAEVATRRSADAQGIVSGLAGQWLAQHLAPTERRARALSVAARRDYQRALGAFTTRFAEADIRTIRRSQLTEFLGELKRRSPSSANLAATVVRQLFSYAVDRLDLDANPAAGLRNPAKARARSRVLDRAEIRVLWRACDLAGYPYGDALKFALCTAQRIGEVGSLRRSDIDSTGDWWIQTTNKSSRPVDLFLAKTAKALVRNAPDFGPDSFVFSASGGHLALKSDTWSSAMERHIRPAVLEAAADLGVRPIAVHWTPHDLRRTARSGMSGWCGIPPDAAERVLNHALGGIRAVYDRADYRPQIRDALMRWDRELHRIIVGR